MESDAEIRCRKRPTLSKFPSTRSNTRLSTRYALDVLHGVGLDAGSTVAAKRVLMRPEAAFPYVFAAEGAQHPPKKPPRSTTIAAAPAQKDATKPTETATKPSGPLFIYNEGWPDGHPLLML